MPEAVIVDSVRTPLAKSFRGSFKETRPDDLAAHAIRELLKRVPQLDMAEVNDVIVGCGQPHGTAGYNIGRIAAILAGLPTTVAGTTVNRFCSSGLQSIAMAAHEVMHEGVTAAIGGGVESISLMLRDEAPNPKVLEHVLAGIDELEHAEFEDVALRQARVVGPVQLVKRLSLGQPG